MRIALLLVTVVTLVSCGERRTTDQTAAVVPEANSFSGKPLYSEAADSAALAKNDSLITSRRANGELSEADFIDIGRSQVGVRQFRKAVETYTEGLAKFPNSYKLLRYRGHRYINLRQLENAIADLSRAEELIRAEQAPVYELDATGKPGPSFQHNIWYHIGLYHFMKRDYAKGAEAMEKSLATAYAGNDKAGASDWLYNCYMRAGQKEKALAVVKPFTADFDIEPKDYPYYRRLLLFNGVIKPEELADGSKPGAEMNLNEMTKMYGMANYYLYSGDSATANILYKKVLEAKHWQGFAYACAELDVKL